MWRGEEGAEDGEEGGGAGLLDAGLEEVGWLEEDGGAEAGEETGEEVEGDGRFEGLGFYILRW
jgi:hypothetical protein